MQSCNFPDEHRRQTLDDIFGAKRGSVYLEGLIDAKSTEEFDSNLAGMIEKPASLDILLASMNGLPLTRQKT